MKPAASVPRSKPGAATNTFLTARCHVVARIWLQAGAWQAHGGGALQRRKNLVGRLGDFLHGQTGAVTVDWVVLAAAVVGLGVASVATVRSGVLALGTDIEGSLTSASVVAISPGPPRVMAVGVEGFWNNLEARQEQMRSATDEELMYWFANNGLRDFNTALAAGYNDVCEECRGAGNRLDLMLLILNESETRGIATQEMRDIVRDAERRYNERFP